ncbi:MAG: hypothetical protein JSR53_06545 [Proteobacteria bacterium]|nr:hypothetical protein [Pseudomonadota bacterium]
MSIANSFLIAAASSAFSDGTPEFVSGALVVGVGVGVIFRVLENFGEQVVGINAMGLCLINQRPHLGLDPRLGLSVANHMQIICSETRRKVKILPRRERVEVFICMLGR